MGIGSSTTSTTNINIIGVECYEERTKQGGKYYSYDLVFALKQQPLVFRRFATTMMVNYVFKFEDINKLGDLLSKTMGCRFKKGELKRSIIASQSKDSSVVYTMGGVITTKKIGGLSYLLYNLELLCVKNHRYPEIGTIFTKELIVLFFIQRKSVNLR